MTLIEIIKSIAEFLGKNGITNPRLEATLINARIRKRWLRGGLKVGVVGEQVDLTYPTKHLGANPLVLDEIVQGRNAFCELLKNAKNPMIIVGAGALARKDGMFSMKEDAIMKMLAGDIPFEEVNTLGGDLLKDEEAE